MRNALRIATLGLVVTLGACGQPAATSPTAQEPYHVQQSGYQMALCLRAYITCMTAGKTQAQWNRCRRTYTSCPGHAR